jgi:hypothetical protein
MVIATTPSRDVVPGFGINLVTYVTENFKNRTFAGIDTEQTIEDFARLPLGQKLYVRPTWKELQRRPGRLDPDEYWKITFDATRRYGKRGLPGAMTTLTSLSPRCPTSCSRRCRWSARRRVEGDLKQVHRRPREPADHPAFQEAFRG